MAARGLCSRREADTYIERGWGFVNGDRVTDLGTRAYPSAIIKLDNAAHAVLLGQMTRLLHKPVGYVSGQPEPGFTPAVTLVRPENPVSYTHLTCLRIAQRFAGKNSRNAEFLFWIARKSVVLAQHRACLLYTSRCV